MATEMGTWLKKIPYPSNYTYANFHAFVKIVNDFRP